MEYFKSSLKSVLGTAPAGTQPTGADTVSRETIMFYFSHVEGYFSMFWINAVRSCAITVAANYPIKLCVDKPICT